MGDLSSQQRDLLVKAMHRLRTQYKQAMRQGPRPGERVKVVAGGRKVLGRILYWGPNNAGYVPICEDGSPVHTGESDGRDCAPHDQVEWLNPPKEQWTSDQLDQLARQLDLPYGAKQLRFEIGRTRGVVF